MGLAFGKFAFSDSSACKTPISTGLPVELLKLLIFFFFKHWVPCK